MRILVRRTDLPIKDARQWRGNQMRLVMTSNGRMCQAEMTEWEEGPDQGTLRDNKRDGLTRWLLVAIRDRYPTDWVKRWSCLQKLAEEEGEENRRLDNPFNIWACSCALRRSILSEARVQLRAEGGREVAVVVHAVFLFKVLRLKVFDLVGWVEVIAENLKIIGSLRQIGSNFSERSESLAVGMVTVVDRSDDDSILELSSSSSSSVVVVVVSDNSNKQQSSTSNLGRSTTILSKDKVRVRVRVRVRRRVR
ncbi:hypothetical protein BY996DRAFT_6557655, partial [Phakopsora pachyrhizi]